MTDNTIDQSKKMSAYLLVCTLIDKAVSSIGAIHNADHTRVKTHIFNTVATKANAGTK